MYSTTLFKKAATCLALAAVATLAALVTPTDARGVPSVFHQAKDVVTAVALLIYALVMARYGHRYLSAGRQRHRDERANSHDA